MRYTIRKRIDHERRMDEQREFLDSSLGRTVLRAEGGALKAVADLFKVIHEGPVRARQAAATNERRPG